MVVAQGAKQAEASAGGAAGSGAGRAGGAGESFCEQFYRTCSDADLASLATQYGCFAANPGSTTAELQKTCATTVTSAPLAAGQIGWWRHDTLGGIEPPLGEATEASGRCAMQSLELACQAVQQGAADAIVFAPFNKHALRLGGLAQEDELRWLQDRLGVRDFVCEFNITGSLWTSRVTSHVPLRDVAALINPGAIGDAVRITG